MDIVIHINKYVFWFAAGWAAGIIFNFLYKKVLVPGYVWIIETLEEKNKKEKPVEGCFESPFDEYDEWEVKTVQAPEDSPVARMCKRMKKKGK